MKSSLFVSAALAAALAAAPFAAFAWGPLGHRLVADLAEAQLTPQARAQVQQLLQGEPEPTLAGVANWADQLRESNPDMGKRTGPWHYVNLGEDQCHYQETRNCPDGNCVVEALHRQAAILADRSQPQAARTEALKFVVHFTGDIQQPLHAGYARDKGANTVQIQFEGKGSNLHALWDSGLLRSRGLDEAHYLAQLQAQPLPAPSPAGSALPPPAAAWAEASCRIMLRPGFYPPGAKLPADYVATWRPVAEAQLRQGGADLAATLNAALGK
ncbi:S1/P1 nuclease [Xanthomonas graminis]|uniref:S1/p1 nuclease n=1 Tax=Xanthomonas graminis pv. phlei TaxID=487906 RepID=A0A0K2ZT84_9XANT|nr:S1/P1 nuclease [Xanthomonas translucens]UKE65001.1 S1/P1 nuclease [Xanthomonas translucens pv. phlei]UKE74209.1 S1/P1 nuclease [Xanthomonas translucens pv. phleipratensis]CTP88237.1 s1/p1 nuclease [Xanthomonas translucens pv. phlei]